MTIRTKDPLWLEIGARLETLGFRKRAGLIFTRQVADDAIGWLGMNRANEGRPAGEVEINPVVGIRHQGVERLVAELKGIKFHDYVPPTVSSPIGYVMPESRYRAWIADSMHPGGVPEDLVKAVAEHGLPFMQAGAVLSNICDYMEQGLGWDHQLDYRRPVAWLLAGDRLRAFGCLDQAEAEIGDRTDPAAILLRSFIAAFRERFTADPSS